jgi:hypothetical protein
MGKRDKEIRGMVHLGVLRACDDERHVFSFFSFSIFAKG